MQRRVRGVVVGWLIAGLGVVIGIHRPLVADEFETTAAPVLLRRCIECHNERDAAGGLVLTSSAGVLRGGDSGPAVVPRDAAASRMLQRIIAGEMPPPRQGKPQPLSAAEVQALNDWIAAGAPWPDDRRLDLFERTTDVRAGRDWWSLQPLVRPAVPKLTESATTPIDAFVGQSLAEAGFMAAPPADRTALIRRLYDDLWGLPPTAQEIAAFAADESPTAYEQLVDRLLASPHFGERWARYWLDLVRYADTSGYERDQEKPFAWKYRDWVVDAINDDLPYDRFVMEQLAGDELPDRNESTVIATGFLRLGTWNDEPNDPEEYQYDRLEDLVHTTSTAFLGLSVKCARCHDHKFDPIAQEDYYRLANAFWPGAIQARGRELLGGPSAEELGIANVLGWTDIRRDPPPLHLLRKGDPLQPLGVVEPGPLSFLPVPAGGLASPPPEARTTLRRLQLARWLVDSRNPVTPRVAVNRLWQHHFGKGLVRSPNDFGFNGSKPTHPELLDWLAAELVENGWKLKPLHKMMVMSRTYRQASLHPQQALYAERDAANHSWWHAERRRRDAESLRDAMLAVGGQLDRRQGGPSFRPTLSADALEGLSRKSGAWQASPAAEQLRRSLYMYVQRSLLSPLMTTFDFADSTLPCGQRDVTTVAPQALALLNNEFVHERSQAVAEQILDQQATPAMGDQQIVAAWTSILGRTPSPRELAAARRHVEAQFVHFSRDETFASADVPVTAGCVLNLFADRGVTVDGDGRVVSWMDASGSGHHALQPQLDRRPVLAAAAVHGRPAIRFDGQRAFLSLEGQVVTQPAFTVLAVINDAGGRGHREIFSNWNGSAGNSVSSLFLGLTAETTIRLTDDFAAAGQLAEPQRYCVLAATAGPRGAAVFQNLRELARRTHPISPRTLTTGYVIGTQGNIDGEYWQGDVAALLVYDRELTDREREDVTRHLLRRYSIAVTDARPDPRRLALASLCHVLLNTNEFLYVD